MASRTLKISSLFTCQYSDADFVVGIKSGDRKMTNRFYGQCKEYFNQKYSALFFTDNEMKNDIFEDAFIILWQKIERGDIFVRNDEILSQGGKRMTCNLNTFLMSIAWNKFHEYARKHREELFEDLFADAESILAISYTSGHDDIKSQKLEIISTCIAKMPKRCNQILTMFYYEEKKLDAIMLELKTFSSKDALKTAKNKCYNTLKNNVLQQYKVFNLE